LDIDVKIEKLERSKILEDMMEGIDIKVYDKEQWKGTLRIVKFKDEEIVIDALDFDSYLKVKKNK